MAKLKIVFFVILWLYTSTAVDASDQTVSEILSRIAAMESEINELKERDVHHSSRIAVLEAREKELTERDAHHSGRIAVLEAREKELKERDAYHSGRIAVMEARGKELTGVIDELRRQSDKTKTQDNVDQVSAVDTQIKEAEPDVGVEKGAGGIRVASQEINGASGTKKSHNRIRQIPQEMPVAFFATLTNHATHLGVHQSIAFDNVITDVGNAYHNSTGVFTAPVSGVYVFSATIFGYSETAHFYFVVNGQFKSQMYVHAASVFETTSQTAVFNLKQGDDVYIQNGDSDKVVNGGHYSTLSGFLLFLNSNEMTSQVVG